MSGYSTTPDGEDWDVAPIEITVRIADGSEVRVNGSISPGGRIVFEWTDEGLRAYAEPPVTAMAPPPANDVWPSVHRLH